MNTIANTINLELIDCTENYWDFVRELRNNSENANGFVNIVHITENQQIEYMNKYKDQYKICIINKLPVGFIGDIDGDLRVCVSKIWKSKGIATFMVNEYCKTNKNVYAKIKVGNTASIALFQKCGFIPKFIIYKKPIDLK